MITRTPARRLCCTALLLAATLTPEYSHSLGSVVSIFFRKEILPGLCMQLQQSNSSIYLAQYFLTNPEIVQTLIKKKRRGISVQIVIDQASLRTKPDMVKALIEDKIPVYVYFRGGKIMHNKFYIIDKEIVITGSANASVNANAHKENMVILEGDDIAKSYHNEFDHLITECTRITKDNFTHLLKEANSTI